MSSIRSTTDYAYVEPSAVPADDQALESEASLRTSRSRGGLIARFIPVLRRPPALLLDVRTGKKDMSFKALIETHVARYRKIGADDMAYRLADFMIRRLPEIEAHGVDADAETGLDNLTETVKMFEHIYIAQTNDGG